LFGRQVQPQSVRARALRGERVFPREHTAAEGKRAGSEEKEVLQLPVQRDKYPSSEHMVDTMFHRSIREFLGRTVIATSANALLHTCGCKKGSFFFGRGLSQMVFGKS
jgi:hypothetical protein